MSPRQILEHYVQELREERRQKIRRQAENEVDSQLRHHQFVMEYGTYGHTKKAEEEVVTW